MKDGGPTTGNSSDPAFLTDAVARALANPTRLVALHETGLLDAPPRPSLDRFTRLVRASTGVPVALLSLVDDARQFFASQQGLAAPYDTVRETPLNASFCKYVVSSAKPLVVEDARLHPVLRTNRAIQELDVIAYAGFPVHVDGEVLGSLCAIAHEPKEWSPREVSMLADLAEVVGTELALHRRARRAERSEAELAGLIAELEGEVHETDQSTRQVGHDLRTPLQVISLGVSSLLAHDVVRSQPEVEKLLAMLERNAKHAAQIVTQMNPTGDTAPIETVNLAALVCDVCVDLGARVPEVRLEMALGDAPADEKKAAPTTDIMVRARASDLRRCVENLVANAQRFARGRVVVRAVPVEGHAELRVEDDGPGLPDEASYTSAWIASTRFHEREGKSGSGLGLSIVRELVERHHGAIHAGPSALGGASFGFTLPIPV